MSKPFICEKQPVVIDRQVSVDGTFSAPKFVLGKDENKAALIFSPKAYIKMRALIDEFSTEVEWHGLVERIDEFTFKVYDILIFPHEVSAATVVSDEQEYQEWLESLDTDTFNAMRFHGHSHVNMAINPSGVDNTYRKNMLVNFGIPKGDDDYFYIFLISNKRNEYNIQIFDITNNRLFDYKDGEVLVTVMCDEDDDLNTFIKEAKRIVTVPAKKKDTTPSYYPSPNQQTKKSYPPYNRDDMDDIYRYLND